MKTILLVISCCGCVCATLGRDALATEPSDISEAVQKAKEIQIQMIRSRPCHPLALGCFGDGPAQLQDLLREHTLSVLNGGNGNIKTLLSDLVQIDDAGLAAEVQRQMNMTLRSRQEMDPPFVFKTNLAMGDVVITVNNFGVGALAVPSGVVIVQAFRKEGGTYVFAAQTGGDLFGITQYRRCEILKSPETNQLWLLIQGQIAGYMGDLERARLYSFDGYKFTAKWIPEDRLNMKIKVNGSQISARYLSQKIYRRHGDIQNCMEEKLEVADGEVLELGNVNHGECEDFETVQ